MENTEKPKPIDTYQWKPITESVSLLNDAIFGWVTMTNFEKDLENYELRKQTNLDH
jgi:hypothetical protein